MRGSRRRLPRSSLSASCGAECSGGSAATDGGRHSEGGGGPGSSRSLKRLASSSSEIWPSPLESARASS
eukprot:scaffold29097_cov31-Tisochrysis_lutea.AAC.2